MKKFLKKVVKRFGGLENYTYLCSRNGTINGAVAIWVVLKRI
jgi:hypothetical protein